MTSAPQSCRTELGTTDTLLLKGVATLNASDFILHA